MYLFSSVLWQKRTGTTGQRDEGQPPLRGGRMSHPLSQSRVPCPVLFDTRFFVPSQTPASAVCFAEGGYTKTTSPNSLAPYHRRQDPEYRTSPAPGGAALRLDANTTLARAFSGSVVFLFQDTHHAAPYGSRGSPTVQSPLALAGSGH